MKLTGTTLYISREENWAFEYVLFLEKNLSTTGPSYFLLVLKKLVYNSFIWVLTVVWLVFILISFVNPL